MIEKWNSKYKKFIETAFREVKRVLRPYSDKFSKKTYTQHQHAVAILLMKYENKPYRDVVELLKELWVYFKFDKSIPHFTTLQKFFSRVPAYVWEFLLTKTYQLFDVKVANVGIDSTGFDETYMSHYYRLRLSEFGNRIAKVRRFMKHSIAIDTDNQAIITSINRQGRRHDNIYFKPLVSKVSEVVKIRNVTADMGYDAESNHEFVREQFGGISIIPLRPVKSGVTMKGKYRKQLLLDFPLKDYHQRSKVETVNFVEKRKFGSDLCSRSIRMRRRELKVIDVVYNIYRFMKLNFILMLGFLQGLKGLKLGSFEYELRQIFAAFLKLC